MRKLMTWPAVALAAISVSAPAGEAQPGQSYVSFSSYKVDFGSCPVGGSCYATLTYTNVSGSTLAEDAISFPKPSNFGPSDENCTDFVSGVGLAPGSSCTDTLVFAPAQAGVYNGRICFNFPDQAPDRVCVHLTGTGT